VAKMPTPLYSSMSVTDGAGIIRAADF